MPRRNRPNPYATTGWEGEARQEDIDRQIEQSVNNSRRREYLDSYKEAEMMLKDDKPLDEIREKVGRKPTPQPYSGGNPTIHDRTKISNEIAERLHKIRLQAIEDALTGKPATPPT